MQRTDQFFRNGRDIIKFKDRDNKLIDEYQY